jgi:hypothetical protein
VRNRLSMQLGRARTGRRTALDPWSESGRLLTPLVLVLFFFAALFFLMTMVMLWVDRHAHPVGMVVSVFSRSG